jgi:hypothetical protein
LEPDVLVAQARESRWCTLVNDIDFRIESPDDASQIEEVGAQFFQFYDSNFIQSIIPHGKICLPIAPERQHCVVIRN